MIDATKISELLKGLTDPLKKSSEDLKRLSEGLEVNMSPEDKKKLAEYRNSNEYKEQQRLFNSSIESLRAFTATFPKG